MYTITLHKPVSGVLSVVLEDIMYLSVL